MDIRSLRARGRIAEFSLGYGPFSPRLPGRPGQPAALRDRSSIQPQFESPDTGGHIGLAWQLTNEGDNSITSHNGATAGSHAFVAFNGKKGIGIAILCNAQLSSEPLGFGLLGASSPRPKTESLQTHPTTWPLSAFACICHRHHECERGPSRAGHRPAAIRDAGISGDRFSIVGVVAEISFERDPSGKVAALVLHQNGRDARAARGELPPPPPETVLPVETLREYAGNYPLQTTFVLTVTEEGGALFTQATGQAKVQVFASAKDEFFLKVVDARISFQRDLSGKRHRACAPPEWPGRSGEKTNEPSASAACESEKRSQVAGIRSQGRLEVAFPRWTLCAGGT